MAQRIGSPADPDHGSAQSTRRRDGPTRRTTARIIGQHAFSDVSARRAARAEPSGRRRLTSSGVEHLFGQVQGGPQFVYRLEIVRRQSDFQLICVPPHETRVDSHVLFRGGRERLDVLVWRLGGCKEPITITARNLPAGVTARPFILFPDNKWGTLVLEAAADAPIGEAEIEVVGTAEIAGNQVERRAAAAGSPGTRATRPVSLRMTAQHHAGRARNGAVCRVGRAGRSQPDDRPAPGAYAARPAPRRHAQRSSIRQRRLAGHIGLGHPPDEGARRPDGTEARIQPRNFSPAATASSSTAKRRFPSRRCRGRRTTFAASIRPTPSRSSSSGRSSGAGGRRSSRCGGGFRRWRLAVGYQGAFAPRSGSRNQGAIWRRSGITV